MQNMDIRGYSQQTEIAHLQNDKRDLFRRVGELERRVQSSQLSIIALLERMHGLERRVTDLQGVTWTNWT